jgi:hypothetical protein
MKAIFLVIAALMFSLTVSASVDDCASVEQELESMRKAQQTLMLSLANNHETFATVTEETSLQLEMTNKKAPKKVLKNMNDTAQAFRQRGVKAKNQAELLNEATVEVIQSVVACLKR